MSRVSVVLPCGTPEPVQPPVVKSTPSTKKERPTDG
jgi:hypothetical protein